MKVYYQRLREKKMRVKRGTVGVWIGIISVFAILNMSLAAEFLQLEGLHRVASNNCGVNGQQAYLGSGSNYTYSEKEVSFEKVASDAPARTVAFGSEVTFYFDGLESDSAYELRIKYLSDSNDRIQSLYIDDQVFQKSLKLPNDQVQDHVVEIPQQLYQDGKIRVSIKHEQGANAVVSELDVYSSLSQPLIAVPLEEVTPELKDITTPQLSPIPVQCGRINDISINLNGSWKFLEKAPSDIAKPNTFDAWKEIQVPGEWYMQGFEVEKDIFTGYARTFDVPKAWNKERVKLRFDAVYSECRVYVNGTKAGKHIGGFTPFELDVTDEVVFGQENLITLEVKNESISDTMASGSSYACHPLGGISRKVTLFAVPVLNISDLTVRTVFDESFTDATLTVLMKVTNENSKASRAGKLSLALRSWKQGKKVKLNPDDIDIPALQPGETTELSLDIPVRNPQKWDCENPNLYVLTCELQSARKTIETVKQRFGFRQVEVNGNKLYVNGQPVKLRGINRHEAHPLRGRSLTMQQWREDARLFRDGNCNFIRTSHYPPAEEFVQACDEVGLFVEMEAPFCWEKASDDSSHRLLTVLQTLEMVLRDKNHPSVIFWSLANESKWGGNFALSSKYVRRADPSRPQIFSYGEVDLVSWHYPGYPGADKAATQSKPTIFDEYSHLNAYNRFELATDQALRERWDIYLSKMWEGMHQSEGCLGGAIWSGIDDTFFPPNGMILGYGTWGPIDGWRRPKPEWWGMKKVYSPIRINDVKVSDSKLFVDVENRQDFSNLNRLEIKWKADGASGVVRSDIAPRSKGKIGIALKQSPTAGSVLELEFNDPRGFVVDTFKLPLGEPVAKKADTGIKEIYTVRKANGKIRIQGKGRSYVIDTASGLFEAAEINDKEFAVVGPHLMVLPLHKGGITRMELQHQPITYEAYTPTCEDWKTASVNVVTENHLSVVTVRGAYKEAEGTFTYRFNADGTVAVDYDFSMLRDVNPRQLGVVFDLPASFDKLNWRRKGFWSTYPDWHIARLEGTAQAGEGVEGTCVGVRTEPRHQWRHDRTAIGSHDFASTKHNVLAASLTDNTGLGLQVLADADRHTRTWIADSAIRLLVADYSNGGCERFLRRLTNRDDRPLKKGDKVSGCSILNLID